MTEQELREMIRKFLDLNPTDEQVEAFYINEVLPHDKRSINEIMSIWNTFMDDKKMPEGFEDVSWGNDACPSIADKSNRIYVWFHDEDTWADVGWKHPMVRYQVVAHHREDSYGQSFDDTVYTNTNDWDEVLEAIETWRKTAREKVVTKNPFTDEYLELFAFDEWGAYQGVLKVIDEPYLVFAPMNQDGTPDMDNFGATEVFEDVSSDGSMLAENEFLAKINEFFGTEFTINDFPLMGGE